MRDDLFSRTRQPWACKWFETSSTNGRISWRRSGSAVLLHFEGGTTVGGKAYKRDRCSVIANLFSISLSWLQQGLNPTFINIKCMLLSSRQISLGLATVSRLLSVLAIMDKHSVLLVGALISDVRQHTLL